MCDGICDNARAQLTFQIGGVVCGELRDRNDLQLLTGCSDDIADGFAHQ